MRKTFRSSFAILSFALCAAATATTLSTSARAQPVSDMDRAAARDLFREGVELQKTSRFAEALDRFTRANAVISAPTNMLRIAECHAALGHLIEALEMYRALQRYPMASNPPPAFAQAVDQGREEMKTVEPRVPELKIDVTPAQVPTLTVTIDDQPLNGALVGASRPINPGVHKIAASAPGYSRAEQTVDMKEKARQSITLNLTSTGGVIYGPAGAGANSPYVQISPAQQGSAQGASDRPPAYNEGEKPRPPADLRSRSSFFIGPRLSLALPAGYYVADGNSVSMSDVAGAGGALGAEAGIRFARIFYFSLLLEGTKYGEKTTSGAISGSSRVDVKYSATSFLAAGKFGIITNPDGFAFLADIGVGYRAFSVDATAGNLSTNTSAKSPDFLVGIGMHFKAGKVLRLVPKIDLSVGSFGDTDDSSTTTPNLSNSSSHVLWTIGLGGYFDINLDKRSAAKAASSPLAPPTSKATL